MKEKRRNECWERWSEGVGVGVASQVGATGGTAYLTATWSVVSRERWLKASGGKGMWLYGLLSLGVHGQEYNGGGGKTTRCDKAACMMG